MLYKSGNGLQRFLDAQELDYGTALSEVRNGQKRSHWMWFVFPQIRGLGRSPMAERFAIGSLEEARAYLAHSVLGERLRECTGLVNAIELVGEEKVDRLTRENPKLLME